MKTVIIRINVIVLICFLLLGGCMFDKLYTNLTIENESGSYISFTITEDSTQSNTFIFDLIRNGKTIEKMIGMTDPIKPKGKGYIQMMSNWKNKVKSDTTTKYLYFVNLNIVDSLHKLASDSIRIKQEATSVMNVTYRSLKEMNWRVVYRRN